MNNSLRPFIPVAERREILGRRDGELSILLISPYHKYQNNYLGIARLQGCKRHSFTISPLKGLQESTHSNQTELEVTTCSPFSRRTNRIVPQITGLRICNSLRSNGFGKRPARLDCRKACRAGRHLQSLKRVNFFCHGAI